MISDLTFVHESGTTKLKRFIKRFHPLLRYHGPKIAKYLPLTQNKHCVDIPVHEPKVLHSSIILNIVIGLSRKLFRSNYTNF